MTTATIACCLAVALLLVAERTRHSLGIGVAKMAASTAFVVVALQAGGLESGYGQILLAGLALCWLGDALLLSSGRSTAFQLGIGAFLLGHVAFAGAFLRLGIDPLGLFVSGLGAAIAGWRAAVWLRPHVPEDFRIPVISYVVVIVSMLAIACAATAAGAPLIMSVGAVGFAISDISVARDRFVSASFTNAAWGLPLYFGSQLALAHSIAVVALHS